jgi:cytochrome c2
MLSATGTAQKIAGDPGRGKLAYQQCASCHDKGLVGPNLKGLFRRKTMVDRKTPMTVANVRHRILFGGDTMPPFGSLTTKQLDDLIAYLGTL